MSEGYWKATKAEPHWLTMVQADYGRWSDGTPLEGGYSADVRFDGCIHLRYRNGMPGYEDEEPDYMHICDLEDHIKRLQALLELAREHFKPTHPDWPD